MTDLPIPTLSGSIPGLLRRGSPVFWRDEITPSVVAWVGPWPDRDRDDGAIALVAPGSSPCIGLNCDISDLALDLSDATGRAHAAWWLGSMRGEDGECSPFSICRYDEAIDHNADGSTAALARRSLYLLGGNDFVTAPESDEWDAVLEAAGLDPDDPRTFDDGSRWVDAEALRLVCLHVAELR